VNGTRLTAEQCQDIADRTMQSLESLGASEALARFEHHVDDVVTDDLTGKPFRRIIFATAAGEHDVYLTVSVSPEPVIVRRARRFRLLAEFVEGWRGATETRQTTKVINR
jgi:hypothetical protein